MRTCKKLIYFFVLLNLTVLADAQSLRLKGRFKSQTSDKLECTYELRTPCELLKVGQGQRLSMNLPANNVYTLCISKPGYLSKSIVISTYADSDHRHHFQFDVTLETIHSKKADRTPLSAGLIFFNYQASRYDYEIYRSSDSPAIGGSTITTSSSL